jgi:Ca-activated chloride channel family protein
MRKEKCMNPLSDTCLATCASGEFRFAAAVAGFGMHLRGTPHAQMPLATIEELALEGARRDPHGYRAGFIDMVRRAKVIR